jgi:hypothetical protein
MIADWRVIPSSGQYSDTLFEFLLVAFASWVVSGNAVAGEPSCIYELETNNNPDLCAHMNTTFNKSFRHLWDAEPLGLGDDPHYRADSRYEFSRLPGVAHETRKTFDMRYSKVPSSPEFDAVEWKEGRAIIGEPVGGVPMPGGHTPIPILVAYIDIDNDGQIDTVAKTGFNGGYSYMAYGNGSGLDSEYLVTWPGEKLDFTGVRSLWPLENATPVDKLPIGYDGSYLRPFVYKGRSYLAKYEIDLGEDYDATSKPPYKPLHETMSILSLHFGGTISEVTHKPIWDIDIVCQYRMNQINK